MIEKVENKTVPLIVQDDEPEKKKIKIEMTDEDLDDLDDKFPRPGFIRDF